MLYPLILKFIFFLLSFLILFSNKMLAVAKCLSELQTGRTLIRLLLQKQSNLGLHCLSRPFLQATSVQKFRDFFNLVLIFQFLDFLYI